MSAAAVCSECGAALPAGASDDSCPRCLLSLGLSTAAAPAASAPRRFGRYDLIAPIGRGAMGVVWRARDPSLDRRSR